MFSSFLFLVVPVLGSLICGGDFTELTQGPSSLRHLVTRSSNLAPIRLTYHYYNFTLNDTTLEARFKNILIPLVNSFFTTSLRVFPVSGNLILRSSQCLSQVVVPEEHRTIGIPNTDVIIYITTNSLTTVSYVAFAGSCETDQYGLNNVLAGTVVINQKNFKDNSMEEWLANIAHEMSHLLGFSQGLMSSWKNSLGLPYLPDQIRKNITIRDTSKTILITPNVVEKARKAFNCSSLEGVELEDAGGTGTAGSHWDKRIMMNDYMTAYIPTDGIFSDISLALFKDTGWYDVDYTLAQSPYFGRNAGCDFFNKKCIINDASVNTSMWCTNDTKWGCDFFALNKGGCSVSTYSSLPAQFTYFSYNSSLGGQDIYTDYCPYNMPLTNGRCRGTEKVNTKVFINSYEVIGSNSRCFESTLMRKPYSVSSTTYAACYEVINCDNTTVTIRIGNDTVYCPFNGSNITLTGWNGWFKCPSNNMVCNDIPCQNFCYARGSCSGRGICNCFSGFGGDFCNVTCNSNCNTCNFTSNCNTCNSGYTLMIDRCCPTNCLSCNSSSYCSLCNIGFELNAQGRCDTCLKGFYMSGGQCLLCPNNCLDCTSATNCLKCVDKFVNQNDRCCPYRCSTCNISSVCTECMLGHQLSIQRTCERCISGYYLDATICWKCSSKCEECISFTSCSICSYGYSFKVDRCCPDYCLTCDSLSYCSLCEVGYALSSYGKCDTCISGYYSSAGQCFKCIDNCESCSSLSKCIFCSNSFINQIDRCCPAHCLYCSFSSICSLCNQGYLLSIEGKCDTCDVGYYKQADLCLACSLNCEQCLSSVSCQACRSGFSLSAGICYLNQCSNCLTCSETFVCQTCNQGYKLSIEKLCDSCDTRYFNSSGTCKSCPNNCLSCSSDGCLTCSPSYFLLSGSCCTPACLACNSLSQCSKCDNGFELSIGGTCDKCIQGYYMSLGKCYLCSSNCLSCFSASDCSACAEGYKVDFGFCSLICPLNCQTCSTRTTCDKCLTGFTPDSQGNCVCLSGFYPLDGICYQCLSQCLTCTSASICTSCMPGYGLVSGSCLSCISPCTRCTELTLCTACKSGYYLVGQSCIVCPTGCTACSSANLCTKCSTAYVLINNACLACSIGCSSCTTQSICKTCYSGFYLSNSQCFNCNSTCSACTSLTICTACKTQNFLSLNTCLSCLENCDTCSNSTSCITCSRGYYLNSTQCLSCPTGCSRCSNSTYCTACSSGYLFSSNKCLQCPPDCVKCSTTTRCTTCLASYYVSSYKCFPCGTNCLSCTSLTSCSTCMSGSTLLNGVCVLS